MEVFIFPNPEYPIHSILADGFVEARLHTDGETNHERISELQKSLARSVANPIYVVVDPVTEIELARYEGAAIGKIDSFVEFLEGSSDVAQLER